MSRDLFERDGPDGVREREVESALRPQQKWHIQGFLAGKKQHPPRTLQQDYA